MSFLLYAVSYFEIQMDGRAPSPREPLGNRLRSVLIVGRLAEVTLFRVLAGQRPALQFADGSLGQRALPA